MIRRQSQASFFASTALLLIAFGLIGDSTRWLHRRPLICFDTKEFLNRSDSSPKAKKICVTHIIRPYAKKQGSVILDISTILEDGRTFSYRTIFWMGRNIGVDRFSDIPGDFTTLFFQVFNQNGISTLKLQDSSSGWKRSNSSPISYLPLCTNTPVLLNKLHFDESCRNGQVLLWKKILESPIIANQQYYKPVDDSFIEAVVSRPLISLIAISLITAASTVIGKKKFYRSLFVFSRNLVHRQDSLTFSITLFLRRVSNKKFIAQNRQYFRIFLAASLAVTAILISSKTNFFTAKHISCKRHQLGLLAVPSHSSSFLDYSSLNICLDEIVSPVDSWLGIVNVVFTLYDQSGKSIKADAIFFIKDTTSFSDASGDIMYQDLRYYNNKGILIRSDSEITSEHYDDLMPADASHALWQDVKDKTTRIADTKYLSPSRILYHVAADSLPLMIAGGLLIYSYRLSLPFLFSLQSSVNSRADDC